MEQEDGRGAACPEELRRSLRAEYRVIQSSLKGKHVMFGDSHFQAVIGEIERLHENVRKPREQVADAETVLQITTALLETVKSEQQKDGSASVADFTTSLSRRFARNGAFNWEALGRELMDVFPDPCGLGTMTGPLDCQPKLKRVSTRDVMHRDKSLVISRPQEVVCTGEAQTAEFGNGIHEMFNVLKAKKSARLESLVLNRRSFAQTVENIFTLTFLVKDGRAEVDVLEDGSHLVMPRNAPSTAQRAGGVVNRQFVFRLDYGDWKFMQSQVQPGDELLKDRSPRAIDAGTSSGNRILDAPPRTPVKTFVRRGKVQGSEPSPRLTDKVGARRLELSFVRTSQDLATQVDNDETGQVSTRDEASASQPETETGARENVRPHWTFTRRIRTSLPGRLEETQLVPETGTLESVPRRESLRAPEPVPYRTFARRSRNGSLEAEAGTQEDVVKLKTQEPVPQRTFMRRCRTSSVGREPGAADEAPAPETATRNIVVKREICEVVPHTTFMRRDRNSSAPGTDSSGADEAVAPCQAPETTGTLEGTVKRETCEVVPHRTFKRRRRAVLQEG